MTKLRSNVIANFGGQAVTILVGILFMPLYIRYLGVESYGVIGFYVSLQAFFTILDMGLSATLNREFARHEPMDSGGDRRQNLLRTLEWIYWPTGALIAATVGLASYPIATHWLNPVGLDPSRTAEAIVLMGLATALQWPTALYEGGFRGLERQVRLNAMGAGFALFRALGSVLVLVWLSPTLKAFLLFQLMVGAIQTLLYRWALWRLLPADELHPGFRPDLLRQVLGFTLGMAGIAALSFALMQSDRLILSRLLPLNLFGYYTIAGTVTAALSTMASSFFNAHFPRYSALAAADDRSMLVQLYHHSSQYLAVAVASVASVLFFFAHDVLLLWTHSIAIATNSSPILSVLVIGTAINAVMCLPYALQLAHGWTRLAFWQNVVSVLFVVPGTWWAAHHYGSVGAASIWVVLNVAYLAVGVPLMHQRLLRGEMTTWYVRDIAPPFVVAASMAALAKVWLGDLPSGLNGLLSLAFACLLVLSAAVLVSPAARQGVVHWAALVLRRK